MYKQAQFILLLLIFGSSIIDGMELTKKENLTVAAFDPYIVDNSEDSCKDVIARFIEQEAKKCGLDESTFYFDIGNQNIYSWNITSVQLASKTKESLNCPAHLITTNPDLAYTLNDILQKKQQIPLSKEEKDFLNMHKVFIRHELGHANDYVKNGADNKATLFLIKHANPLFASIICYQMIPKCDAIETILAFIVAASMFANFSNLGLTLYHRTWEKSADDFSIRHTKNPKALKSVADYFHQSHPNNIAVDRNPIETFLLLFNPSNPYARCPCDRLRYKKFSNAYNLLRKKTEFDKSS